MREILNTEILGRAMWNSYQTMKDDNFQFDGYSNEDKIMMINHILPYFEMIEEYDICEELKNKIETI
jgi:hypothetical protein